MPIGNIKLLGMLVNLTEDLEGDLEILKLNEKTFSMLINLNSRYSLSPWLIMS